MTNATADRETPSHDGSYDSEPAVGPSYDDINTPVILMVGVISAIVTICIIFFVQGLSYQWKNSFIRNRSFETVNKSVQKVVEQQRAHLNGDPQRGIKPIDEAMTEVISRFGR